MTVLQILATAKYRNALQTLFKSWLFLQPSAVQDSLTIMVNDVKLTVDGRLVYVLGAVKWGIYLYIWFQTCRTFFLLLNTKYVILNNCW